MQQGIAQRDVAKHASSTKTSEKVGELEDEPFRKVEEGLKVQSEGPQTLMLGNNKAAKAGNGRRGSSGRAAAAGGGGGAA